MYCFLTSYILMCTYTHIIIMRFSCFIHAKYIYAIIKYASETRKLPFPRKVQCDT